MGRAGRILIAIAGLALLTLSLCHCGWIRPEPKVRGLSPREAGRLSDLYTPQDPKPQTGPVQEMPPERREALGDLLLQSRDYESSLVNYLQVLRLQPERVDIRYKVGVIYLLGGHYEQARLELQRVIQARPDMLEAYEALGLVHLQTNQYPQAIDTFRQVLGQDSRRPQTRYFLGTAYLAAGKPREAIAELEACAWPLKITPPWPPWAKPTFNSRITTRPSPGSTRAWPSTPSTPKAGIIWAWLWRA
ncbi:MAG: tetratricopeptide repeat protein [Deltaproteobacteria bacterium]|nr:tetratricopeptide repeat protein [Deltaproteobacteria bacterium]